MITSLKHTKFYFLAMLMAIFCGVASAQNTEDASEIQRATILLQNGDFETAIPILIAIAENGNSTAQNAVGQIYEAGSHVTLDTQAAHEWYLRSATQGDMVGQYRLGKLIQTTENSRQNDEIIFEWLLLSAEQGFAPAQYEVGMMLHRGRGVEQNVRRSEHWLAKSSSQKYPLASYDWANILVINGRHPSLPELLYKNAAEQGYPPAMYRHARNLYRGIDSGSVLYKGKSSEQLYSEYIEWLRLAAERGHSGAITALRREEDWQAREASKISAAEVVMGILILGATIAALSPDQPASNADADYHAEQKRLQRQINTDLAIGWVMP